MELRLLLWYNHPDDIRFLGAWRAGGEHRGKYLNPGCIKFQRSLNSEIYIDKTEMISYFKRLAEGSGVCVTGLYDGDPADQEVQEALSYAVQMAFYAGQKYYTTIQELDSGKGYVDLVYLPSPKTPDKPALLIELKYDKSLETAADQIRKKNYPQKLLHYKDNLLLISINYERDADSRDVLYKHHSLCAWLRRSDFCQFRHRPIQKHYCCRNEL